MLENLTKREEEKSMANRKHKNKNKKMIYLIVAMVGIILFAMLPKKSDKIQKENEPTTEEIGQIQKENITTHLQGMEERDRMEYYFGMFLEYVESSEYEKAYNLLYPEFKNRYFPTLKSFEEYMPTVFSEMTNIEHDNIERNGDVYVLWIYITDAINGKPGEKREMKFVIQENDYNDFVLSFSVI